MSQPFFINPFHPYFFIYSGVNTAPQLKGRARKNPPAVSRLTVVPSTEETEVEEPEVERAEAEEIADEDPIFSITERPELDDFQWYVEEAYYEGGGRCRGQLELNPET